MTAERCGSCGGVKVGEIHYSYAADARVCRDCHVKAQRERKEAADALARGDT